MKAPSDRVQLMDTETLTPQAIMEGNSLTALRTPAVSAVAVDYLAPESIDRMVVFGTGPQAHTHIAAMAEVRDIGEVVVAAAISGSPPAPAWPRTSPTPPSSSVAPPPPPRFSTALFPDHAVVVAMGSPEPEFREHDSQLMGRAQVVVEDRATGGVEVDTSRPRVFKCVGMSWEDLAVAVGVVDPTVVPD